jgi:hypothetical protein
MRWTTRFENPISSEYALEHDYMCLGKVRCSAGIYVGEHYFGGKTNVVYRGLSPKDAKVAVEQSYHEAEISPNQNIPEVDDVKEYRVTVSHGGKKQRWRNEEGLLDREDGPALIDPEYCAYYKNGQIHRVGGPAIYSTEGEFYWLNDQELSQEEYEIEVRKIERPDVGTKVVVNGVEYTLA